MVCEYLEALVAQQMLMLPQDVDDARQLPLGRRVVALTGRGFAAAGCNELPLSILHLLQHAAER